MYANNIYFGGRGILRVEFIHRCFIKFNDIEFIRLLTIIEINCFVVYIPIILFVLYYSIMYEI